MLSVHFYYGFVRAEADRSLIFVILGKSYRKFTVYILLILRAYGEFHINFTALYAF